MEKDKEVKMQSPWDYSCPPYDQRSSCFVNAGGHHGVGHVQPVGKTHAGNLSTGELKNVGAKVAKGEYFEAKGKIRP